MAEQTCPRLRSGTGKYIYCIIKKPDSFKSELCGIDKKKIQAINSKKLAVIVSDAMIEDYPITRENTMTHQRLIEEVMKKYSPVLPVSFGTVAESEAVVRKKLLIAKENELLEALEEIDGKVELNLKAIWLDMPRIFQMVVLENPELKHLKNNFSGKVLPRNEAINVGKLVAQAIESKKTKTKEDILSLLRGIFVDYKETPLLGEEMVFNLAFLVPANKQKSFDRVVQHFDDQYAEDKVYFKYIGPNPAFNFIKVPISFK